MWGLAGGETPWILSAVAVVEDIDSCFLSIAVPIVFGRDLHPAKTGSMDLPQKGFYDDT